MSENDKCIDEAIHDFILDSQICLEVEEEFVREIFIAGAKWQRLKLMPNPTKHDVKH